MGIPQGTQATCATCAGDIVYQGDLRWSHIAVDRSYDHPAAPGFESVIVSESTPRKSFHPDMFDQPQAATMEPNTHIAYLCDENKHLARQLEMEQEQNRRLMSAVSNLHITIRTLIELYGEARHV